MAISAAQAIGRSAPSPKPKVASAAWLDARRGQLRERRAREHDRQHDP